MPRYRFATTDNAASDDDDRELDDDQAAEAYARERSRAEGSVITVHRHSAHVDAWEYVSEADERE
ncbi:MAG: hypothetical protein M0T80_07650 [Actinomycetota bacterium]|nr:hypothetical protein [Actinomycetota bacterium]